MTRVFITFRRQKNMQFRVSLLLMLTSKDKLRTAAVIFKLDENLFCVFARKMKRGLPLNLPSFTNLLERDERSVIDRQFQKVGGLSLPKMDNCRDGNQILKVCSSSRSALFVVYKAFMIRVFGCSQISCRRRLTLPYFISHEVYSAL